MKLLIVDSDHQFLLKVNTFLKKEGFSGEVVSTFLAASEKISLYEYDCILLDLNLSDTPGISLLELLKKDDRSDGVIIISKPTTIEEKLRAFDLGADDFLIKPFDLSELQARINAVVRRKKFNVKSKLYFANLVIDFSLKKVFVWDKALTLTKKEYEILLHLIANKNRVVAKSSLAEYLWGDQTDSLDSYDFLFAHIKNLRKKLKEAKAEIEIQNSYKMGYQIIEL